MKKTALSTIVALALALAACGPSSEERAADRAATSSSKAAERAERSQAAASSSAAASANSSQQASAIKQELLTAFGVSRFSEVLAADPSMWAGYITDVAVDGNKVVVSLQVDRKSAEGKQMGDRAASALSTLLTKSSTEGLSWVVVQDGAGTVISQEQLSPVA